MPPMVGVEITWFGHAAVFIEMDGVRMLTDPVLGHRIGPLVRVVPEPEEPGPVDCVLISHLHADHADIRSLRAVRCRGPFVAPHPGEAWLTGRGLADAHGLCSGQGIRIRNVQITAIPAVHDRRRWWLGPAANPVGYLIRGSRSVYFAADTDLFLGMAELRGQVDVALLPVWGWGSRVGPGHLDPESAAAAVALIAPKLAIPIHWGTYVMAHTARRAADRARPAREFAAYAERYAPAVEVRRLAPGEGTVF
ncbi:MAG: MBL fold metallo-hydrolase [Solirubrobacterales bacterium]|nr:MBL fold metallo-hydrolase [Solirubrobacterales bacterium]